MKCEICDCGTEPTFQFTPIESRRVVDKKYMCDDHAQAFLAEFRSDRSVGAGPPGSEPGLICVDFEMTIYHDGPEEQPGCVYLHEAGGTRRFATMIGAWAWSALMTQIKRYVGPRPLAHEAWAATIRELGGELQDVVVEKRSEADQRLNTKLRIVKDRRLVGVDVRASDAYILAVVCGVPVLVVEESLEAIADKGETPTDK